jgi:acyl carrier protein
MPADAHVEIAARESLARVLEPGAGSADLDLDADMSEDLGLTSLNKVVFLMAVCDETEVSLSAFTESDVAGMRTLRDVIEALAQNITGGS